MINDISEQDLRIFKILLTDKQLATEFVNTQRPDLFIGSSSEFGYAVYNYIKKYKNIPTQRVLIQEHGENESLREQINIIFESLSDINIITSEYPYELDRLKQRFIDVKLADLKDEFKYNDKLDTKKSLAEMEQTLKDIRDVQNNHKHPYIQQPIKKYLQTFKQQYKDKVNGVHLGEGILTGYSYFDYVTNGINSGELIIIGGETNTGKSIFLNNIAIQMYMQKNTIITDPKEFTKGCNILYFSLEMSYDDCFQRLISRISDVPMNGIRDGKLSKAEIDAVGTAGKFISKYPYEFEIIDIARGVTIEVIEDRIIEAQSRYHLDAIFVDYLGLMDIKGPGEDWYKLGMISGQLHELARTYNTRVITAVQLNKLSPNKKHEKHEIINVNRVGRSGLIAHNANIVIQIENREDENLRNDFPYHFVKNRRGQKGFHTIQKKFAHGAIFDVPYVNSGIDSFGALSGFEVDDISEEIAKLLK